jgi:hypothetical protein
VRGVCAVSRSRFRDRRRRRFPAAIIERVVDQLKRDAEIHAVAAAGGPIGLGAAGKHRPDLAGGGEERGGLGADYVEIIIFGRLRIFGSRQLHHLTLGDHRSGRRKDVETRQRAHLHHHLESLAEQKIANEHARLIAPQHPGCELAAPHVTVVDDVVVQQRGRVHEFDG